MREKKKKKKGGGGGEGGKKEEKRRERRSRIEINDDFHFLQAKGDRLPTVASTTAAKKPAAKKAAKPGEYNAVYLLF
jgi:hypothetical protein